MQTHALGLGLRSSHGAHTFKWNEGRPEGVPTASKCGFEVVDMWLDMRVDELRGVYAKPTKEL